MYKFLLFLFSSYFSLSYASSPFSENENMSHLQLRRLVLNQRQFDDKLNNCDASTELVISGPFMSKLPLLLSHTELAGLNFSLSSGLDDDSLKEICKSLPNLIVLNLAGMEVTNDGLNDIHRLNKLQVLDIRNTFIDDLGKIPAHITVITK